MHKKIYSIYIFTFFISVASTAQTITSLTRVTTPTVPLAGNLIANGNFETGAPPNLTWYQWAKTGCNPTPVNRNPPSWTVTSNASNSSGGSPVRYATWGKLVQGSGTYPFIPTNQSGLYEVYSTSSTACTNTNTTATSNDPGTFPLGVQSQDGLGAATNYLYFGNGTGSVSGFPTPLAAWVGSSTSPTNLRVYNDNSSLGTLTGSAPVTLTQTITTVSGTNYRLEFWVSGEELALGTQKDGFFQLQIGTQNLFLAIPGSANNHGLGNQFYYQVSFNAASTSTIISFINYCHPVGGNWNGYLTGQVGAELILDDVRMNTTSFVLPVHLLSFDGQKNNSDVNLSWKVENEINFDRYEIERSFDDRSFSSIQSIAINNTNNGNYYFTDNLSNFQQSAVVYYRLKIVDLDGSFTFSKIIKLKLTDSPIISIYPTIVSKGQSFIIETSGITGKIEIRLTNISGQTVRQITKNATNIIPIETLGLKAGTYIVAVISLSNQNYFKIIIR